MKDVEVIKAHNTLSPRARTNFEKRLRVAAYCRVSTDTEDKLNSYKSQVKYYTELIKSKPEWSLAGIYADEAITGTQVKKREDFQRLINDCMNGDVDMVITKSISRFARNTLDTLKYVRMLKDKGVKNIKFMCIIAAPEGLEKLHKAHPDVQIYCGSLDRELNENAYICPGLGDAGDRIFGTK